MPIGAWEDWDEAIEALMEQGYTKEEAEKIAGSMEKEQEEKGKEHVIKLWNEIKSCVRDIMEDINIKLVSTVSNPAVSDSKWVMMKDDNGNGIKMKGKYVLKEEEEEDKEKRIAYAPVLIPNKKDEENDVAPAHSIEEAAHNFMKRMNGDEIDEEHSMVKGKGNIVESWILKDDREFKTYDGNVEEYPEGTWMLEVEFEEKTWKKIKNGELTGFSMTARTDDIELNKSLDDNIDEIDDVERLFEVKEKLEEKIENINKNNKKEEKHNKEVINMSEEKIEEFEKKFDEIEEKIKEIKESNSVDVDEIVEKVAEELEDTEKDTEEKENDEGETEKQIENLADAKEWLDENAPEKVQEILEDAMQSDEKENDEGEKDKEKSKEGKEASMGDTQPKNETENNIKQKNYKEVLKGD